MFGRFSVPYANNKHFLNRCVSAAGLLATFALITSSAHADPRSELRYDSNSVYHDSHTAKVCLDFNEYIETGQNYLEFIEVKPLPKRPISAVNERWRGVCISGLEYSTEYSFRVKQGLLGEDHTELWAPVDLTIDTGLRDSSLSFPAQNYILPVHASPQIPIDAVNTPQARLNVYRISPRNLMDSWVRSSFQTSRMYLSDFNLVEEELGQKLWTGEVSLPKAANVKETFLVPIDALADSEPGLYLVSAADTRDEDSEDSYGYYDNPVQWLVRTDIGLTSFLGQEGLTISARSLASAEIMADVSITLLAKNNTVLAEATTTADGLADFAAELVRGEKGLSPAMIIARKGDDFSFLKLSGSPLDLADRGISGNKPLSGMNVYAYAERGIYRRGEAVNIIALLRDQNANAMTGLPLHARIVRPDQTVVSEQMLTTDQLGGYHVNYQLARSAPSGTWKVQFYNSEQSETPVGESSFLVADIVPPRIKVTFTDLPPMVRFYDGVKIKAVADFLFGAPAADLEYTADFALQPAENPFEGYEAFTFGNPEGKTRKRVYSLEYGETDANGGVTIPFSVEALDDKDDLLTVPMEANIRLEVRDVNGRATTQKALVPLITEPHWVGIRPLVSTSDVPSWWDEDVDRITFPMDQPSVFEIATLDSVGVPTQLRDMTYRLVEQDYFSQWYEQGGEWRWRRDYYDTGLTEGDVIYDGNGSAELTFTDLQWGSYRLEIIDDAGAVKSVLPFRVGWTRGESLAGTPDAVEITLDQPIYRENATAQVNIKAPFTGHIQLMLAKNGSNPMTLLDQRPITEGESFSLSLPVEASWGAGVYLLANAYKPDEQKADKGPNRAIGVQWLELDRADRKLGLAIQAPEQIKSRQTMSVTITADNIAEDSNGQLFVTLAAVDEGVLQLDNFTSPSPSDYFFAQYRLPVALRDLYGFIIDAFDGKPASVRSGAGDEMEQLAEKANRFRPDNDITITSLFSGVVAMVDGQAVIEVPVPDFNGELRLMSVAWSDSQFGSASQPMKVSDPLVALLSKPRFMAIGDQSSITVQLFNQSRPETSYQVELVNRSGGLFFPEALSESVRLAKGDNATFVIPVEANKVGTFDVMLRLKGADGYQQTKSFIIGVRPSYAPLISSALYSVEPGEEVVLLDQISQTFDPSTVVGKVVLQNSPSFGLSSQLKGLDRYPYGCLEQTTSKAMPMLHFDALAKRTGYQSSLPASYRIESAIAGLLDKQKSSGGFGLWTNSNGVANWASVYAIDFLSRANADGHAVPAFALKRAYSWMNRLLNSSDTNDNNIKAKLYAHYVLAREGYGGLELAHQRFNHYKPYLSGQPEAAMLGAAFAQLGDSVAAKEAFELALSPVGDASDKFIQSDYGYNYGTRLRNQAMILSLAYEQGLTDLPEIRSGSLVEALNDAVNHTSWLSTQERAWLTLAALALDDSASIDQNAFDITLGGVRETQVIGEGIDITTPMAQEGVSFKNDSDQRIWVEESYEGITWAPPTQQRQGVSLSRQLLNTDMKAVNLNQLKQGEIYLVHIKGAVMVPQRDGSREMLLVDYLPAGFEIENADIENSAGDIAASWLEANGPAKYVEALDDRYVVAFDANYNSNREQADRDEFERLYVVRAVSKGHYTWPNTVVEDMINPMVRGSTGVRSVTIK